MDNIYNHNKTPDEVGAMWYAENKRGVGYFSMKLNIDGKELHLKSFKNGAKRKGDRKPEYIVYFSKNGNKQENQHNQEQFN